MRIGLLSICAMMFLLYGTDCRADRNVKDFEVSGASQEVENKSFPQVHAKSKKSARRNEKRREAKRSQQDLNEIGKGDNKAVVVDSDYQQGIEESNPQPSAKNNENPWFRDKRSFADVVKGVKKEDENVREKSAESEEQFFDAVGPAEIDLQENKNAESEEQFFDAVGPEYNALSEEKTSDKFDSTSDEGKSQQNIDGFANVAEGVKKDNKSHQVKKAHHAEMTKEQRAARSKKAFEARRSREKQRKKFADEALKNYKSAQAY